MTKRAIGYALALALVVAIALPVWAAIHRDRVDDGNDVDGLLDVKKVKLWGDEKPRWTYVTFARWTVERTFDRGFFTLYLDTFGKGRFDYYVVVRSNGYSMKGYLFRDRRNKPDYRVARLKTWRKNARSATVIVPLAKLRIPQSRKYFKWIAESLMVGTNCRATCIDRIPDSGTRKVILVPEPKPTPTPTPTQTSTPSPTPTPTASVSPSPSP